MKPQRASNIRPATMNMGRFDDDLLFDALGSAAYLPSDFAPAAAFASFLGADVPDGALPVLELSLVAAVLDLLAWSVLFEPAAADVLGALVY